MWHARATGIGYCAYQKVEDTYSYNNIIQLPINGNSGNWRFHNKFEKMEETNFKTIQETTGVGGCVNFLG